MPESHVSERLGELQLHASSIRYDGISIEDQLALIDHVRTLQKRNENLSEFYRGASKVAEEASGKLAEIRILSEDPGLDDKSFRAGVEYWLND
jgi:hypothetical protein